jgi:predicted ATP-grasp superfamily ATP-dependent carboligase
MSNPTSELARAEATIRSMNEELRQLHELCEVQRVTIREQKGTIAGLAADMLVAKAKLDQARAMLAESSAALDDGIAASR